MKKIITRHGYKCLFIIFTFSCFGNKPVNENPQEAGSDESLIATSPDSYYFRDVNDQVLGSIHPGNPSLVSWGNISLMRVGRGEKTKYRNESNENIYEIKYSEDGFKLRDPGGRLLWKVKYREERLKIADNEEMINGFEIIPKGRIVDITRNSAPFQSIDMNPQSPAILIKNSGAAISVSGPTRDRAMGIMAIENIPGQEKMILIAEVLLAGKD